VNNNILIYCREMEQKLIPKK